MFARAVVLLLIVLNLGVGLWWALRAPPQAEPPPAQPPGVPPLLLASEVRHAASEAPRAGGIAAADGAARAAPPAIETSTPAPGEDAPAAEGALAPAAAATAPVCLRIGPFADEAALARASARLQAQVERAVAHATATAPRGWRVWLPPQPDREAAQAVVERLRAAGFDDHFILGGDEANAIALGRFGSESAARRHAAALRAAGFDARAEALGAATTAQWLDVVAAAEFDAQAAGRASGAEVRPLDCAAVRG
ncbi:SPOR domain-containing protein [Luteimonas huabeiensis]|uniref:SPOR domain-containing protein n=1 Tax=Luteimonas huabeiensis TaxID=1244513 RepID=UPI0004675A9C|nr:SPOR domain-containing protein [Luteimonas huabeiensis]